MGELNNSLAYDELFPLSSHNLHKMFCIITQYFVALVLKNIPWGVTVSSTSSINSLLPHCLLALSEMFPLQPSQMGAGFHSFPSYYYSSSIVASRPSCVQTSSLESNIIRFKITPSCSHLLAQITPYYALKIVAARKLLFSPTPFLP